MVNITQGAELALVLLRFIWLRLGASGRLLWRGNEPSGFVKAREFLDTPSDFQLVK
jgi:hypothetical protein